jgi:hypothetical protein
MLGKVLNNQKEMKERMDRNESQDACQQLEQNINLGIPVPSLEGFYELEEKLVQPAYMSQLVFKLLISQTFKFMFFRKLKLNLSAGSRSREVSNWLGN